MNFGRMEHIYPLSPSERGKRRKKKKRLNPRSLALRLAQRILIIFANYSRFHLLLQLEKQWGTLLTYLSNTATTEPNQRRNTETPPSAIGIAGKALSRSDHSQTLSKVHSEFTGRTTNSLCWSSRFRTSSKPSSVNPGRGVQNRSHMIPLISKRRINALSTTVQTSDYLMLVSLQVPRRSSPTRLSPRVHPNT